MRSWLARSRGWISLAVLIPLGAIAVLSKPIVPIDSWSDFAFELFGCVLFTAGVWVRWWATLYIGGRKTDELVCEGPYSICRNPIYLGTFLLTLAVAVLLESLTLTIGVILVSVFYFSMTVSVEEQRLLRIHGSAFTEYCRQVPRIIPRPTKYRSPAAVELRIDGVRAEFTRALRYVWLPIGCHLITHLRAQTWWPNVNLFW